jgi:sulfur carrier protein
MDVLVNGESRALEAGVTVADLVLLLGLSERRLAVEVNGDIVPRSEHPRRVLHAGDRVEVVQAIGGG